jgi:soluble P-type ATPase
VHKFYHLVCDLNGTLAVDEKLVVGVSQRLRLLGQSLDIAFLTAATHGGADAVSQKTGIVPVIISTIEDKTQYIQSLSGGTIVVVGTEGAATKLLTAADVLVFAPLDALDLFLCPKCLTATLHA